MIWLLATTKNETPLIAMPWWEFHIKELPLFFHPEGLLHQYSHRQYTCRVAQRSGGTDREEIPDNMLTIVFQAMFVKMNNFVVKGGSNPEDFDGFPSALSSQPKVHAILCRQFDIHGMQCILIHL